MGCLRATSAQEPLGDSPLVNVRVELDREVLPADRAHTAVVKVSLEAPLIENPGDRPPVNISLVIDRSGSMQGDKIAQARNAALEALKPLERNRGFSAYGMLDVQAYALLGEPELALTAMEECADIKYLSNWQAFKYLPHYDSIRNDPRFSAALSRLSAAADEARKRATEEGLL